MEKIEMLNFEKNDKLEKKNKIEYPQKLELGEKDLGNIMDGTENKKINFARAGGKSRWYPMEDGNEGDGDSLYLRLSENEKKDFYLVDGKNINDVGNFVVGFYNDLNQEIEVGGEKIPMAVYMKRRDRMSPNKKENIKDSDVTRDEAYKFCFYDKDVDEFITVTMDENSVHQGQIRNWAEIKKEEDKIIIDHPISEIYDDGYKVGQTGGPETFEIVNLISSGKIKKARELMDEGDVEKAKKIAEKGVQLAINKEGEDLKKFDELLKICQEFQIEKETLSVANKYFDVLSKKNVGIFSGIEPEEKMRKLKKLSILLGKDENNKEIKECENEIVKIYLNQGIQSLIKFSKEFNINMEDYKKEIEKSFEKKIDDILKNRGYRGNDSILHDVKSYLDLGLSLEFIINAIEKSKQKISFKELTIGAFINYFDISPLFRDQIERESGLTEIQGKELEEIINSWRQNIKDMLEYTKKMGLGKEQIKEYFKDYLDTEFSDSDESRLREVSDKVNKIINEEAK